VTLGSDISGVDDLDAALTEVSGRLSLGQAVLRRFRTPTGTLPEDPAYGFDLTEVVGTTMPPLHIEQKALAQVYAEEEVQRASADARLLGETMTLDVTIVDAAGPFTLTVSADALNVSMFLDGAPI
jgi:hypothetical protein